MYVVQLIRQLSISLTLMGLVIASAMAQDVVIPQQLSGLQGFTSIQAWGLSAEQLSEWKAISHHQNPNSLVHHCYYQKHHNDIPVENAIANVTLSADASAIIAANHRYLNSKQPQQTKASIDATTAIIAVGNRLDLTVRPTAVTIDENNPSIQKTIYDNDDTPWEALSSELRYFVDKNSQEHLCWLITVEIANPSYQHLQYFVSAESGLILHERDLVLRCSFGPSDGHPYRCNNNHHSHTQSRVASVPQASSLMPANYRAYDTPIESPNHGSRTLITDPADSLASPYGWHDTDGSAGAEQTITSGNNVLAQDDFDGNNNTSGFSPDGGTNLNFDFTLDFTQDPNVNIPSAENLSSSITNLFYWNNLIHDIFYHYGFTEASGNFQENNYGRGGSGGDYVFADAVDGSGSNNATFATPSDGNNPRMSMFLWSSGGSSSTTFDVTSPSSVSGTYSVVPGNFGPSSYNISGDLALVDDGSANGSEGCGTLTNGSSVSGKIAVIDRGNCQFGTKALNAQNAGAIAVLICNNVSGAPITMSPGNDGGSVTIPAVMISQGDCATIRAALPGVSATLDRVNTPDLDGSFDNGIIAHEYGHGISNRLTGGRFSAGCLGNTEQAGEGWSDFFGLVLTHEAGDTRNTPRGIGTYAINQPTSGDGIRPFPYTADMTENPSTYDDIKTFSVPHGVGSVWCTMLWDMYWDLVDLYGYDPDLINGSSGNNIAIQLVMDGLQLQPCSPGFTDARDAILLADQINYNGIHQCLIWEAFARRGLGASASQGSSNSRSDGTEGYDLPSGVSLTTAPPYTEIVAGETFRINTGAVCGCDTTNQVQLTNTIDDLLSINNVAGATQIGNTLTSPVTDLHPGDTLEMAYDVTLGPCSITQGDTLFYDDVEGAAQFTSASIAGGTWETSNTIASSGTTSWYANDPAITSDYVLESNSPIVLDTSAVLRFNHRYETEATWDGGVMEVSIDAGLSWQDAGNLMIENGYPSAMAGNGSSNLAGRPAFTGNSDTQFDASGWITTSLDLSSLTGESILFRFRFASDDNTTVGGLSGWYIDDISIEESGSAIVDATISVAGATVATTSYDLKVRVPDRSIIYVDKDAAGRQTGESWDNAYNDLASALQAAGCDTSLSEIWVSAGTYLPTSTDDRSASFELQSGLTIYGGFAGGTEVTVAERDIGLNPTILSGDIGQPNMASDNSYHIVTADQVDSTAILDGFIITGGYADGPVPSGAGILHYSGSAEVDNCTVVNNYSQSVGAGLSHLAGTLTVRNTSFSNNTTSTGNGVAISHQGGVLTLEDIFISANVGSIESVVETLSPATLIIRGTTNVGN